MLRRALIPDYQNAGVVPNAEDAFNFSMWRGYLADPYQSEALGGAKPREPRSPISIPAATPH